MSENVVPLGRIHNTGEPVATVIEELEDLLARAKRGEIRAIAFVYVDGGDYTTTGWALGSVHAAMLVGAIARLQYNACKDWEVTAFHPSAPDSA